MMLLFARSEICLICSWFTLLWIRPVNNITSLWGEMTFIYLLSWWLRTFCSERAWTRRNCNFQMLENRKYKLRLRKRHNWIRAAFITFIARISLRSVCQILTLNSKGLNRNSKNDQKKSHCRLLTSPQNVKKRHFQVVVVQWRQRNAQKMRDVRAKFVLLI